jgi:hypothetical protein
MYVFARYGSMVRTLIGSKRRETLSCAPPPQVCIPWTQIPANLSRLSTLCGHFDGAGSSRPDDFLGVSRKLCWEGASVVSDKPWLDSVALAVENSWMVSVWIRMTRHYRRGISFSSRGRMTCRD